MAVQVYVAAGRVFWSGRSEEGLEDKVPAFVLEGASIWKHQQITT